MAGGTITRITFGNSTTEIEGSFEGFFQNLSMNAGDNNAFKAKVTDHKNPEKEPKAGKYFVKGWWTNHKNEPIKRGIYGQTLHFHIEMDRKHTKPGDVVYFSLYDCDRIAFGNDVVQPDEPIDLFYLDSGKPYTWERVTSDYKVIIEVILSNRMERRIELDQDNIYELYFWCSYNNRGNIEHKSLPYNFHDYLQFGALVIDRYKMPGLNPSGDGIAEDMAYGTGFPIDKNIDKKVYSKGNIAQYTKDYTTFGFDVSLHTDFANQHQDIETTELKELVIVAKAKPKEPEPFGLPQPIPSNNTRIENLSKFLSIEEMEEARKKLNQKAIYNPKEMYNTKTKKGYDSGKDIKDFHEEKSPITGKWRDDDYLFWDFKNTAELWFARGELQENLDRMIDKFKRNEGGIYEDEVLTRKIANHLETTEYCVVIEDYIAENLKTRFNKLEEVEDKEPYFLQDGEFKNLKGTRAKKGKDGFDKPTYSYDKSLWDAAEGLTIALNDIWSAEVILKEVKFSGDDYTAKYEITLWDHFGLDLPDMEKKFNSYWSIKEAFICWFVLQHLRGYKPFITKMTFTKEFKGSLDIGKSERVGQRVVEEQKRKEEEEKMERLRQIGRKKPGEY